MAEPSMPTAHTSGSALWVRRRHQRVAPAPVTTPRKPVKQVMAPKMRLWDRGGGGWVERKANAGAPGRHLCPASLTAHLPHLSLAPPVLGPTGRAAARLCRLLHDLGAVQVQRDPHAQGPCGEGHGRRGQGGEDVAAAGERPGSDTEWGPEAAFAPHSPRGWKALLSPLAGSGREGYGSRVINTWPHVTPSTAGSGDSRESGHGC